MLPERIVALQVALALCHPTLIFKKYALKLNYFLLLLIERVGMIVDLRPREAINCFVITFIPRPLSTLSRWEDLCMSVSYLAYGCQDC